MNRNCILVLMFILVVSGVSLEGQSNYCLELNQDGLIFCDDFESLDPMSDRYFEVGNNGGDFVPLDGVGREGSRAVRTIWQNGEVGAGGMKKSFGRTPSNYIGKHAAHPDSTFMEVYWKMDVRHQVGWQGNGPAKLSRALTLANANWATGAMAHLWSGGPGGEYLGMDPASGIDVDGNLVTTKYNDFSNMRWLGWLPGITPLYADEQAGRWFCIEGHVRLNTPGLTDGIFEFWINDTIQAGSYGLNWHGNWNTNPDNYGINAVFFENYWNDGSPIQQERYFDNIVIATKRIGCPETITAIDPLPLLENSLKVNRYGFEWDLPPGLHGEIYLYSLLGQVVHSFEAHDIGFCPFSHEVTTGLWFYTCRLSNGQMISGSVLVP